ncbi:hypothetical protein [Sorangium sp. So ce128]|uniref:hypothetical protein n=1 Tax=Sorangium sp. So ce128 TaxID=3133281 RepID=UPI003F5E80E2
MTLEEALRRLAPFAEPQGFDIERLRQSLASDPSSARVTQVLREALEAGEVTPSAWQSTTGSPTPDDFSPAFGRLWDELCRVDLADWAHGFPECWSQAALRLWAYTNGWLISSEDEDLALMTEDFVPGLLEVAREPACPKREYVLGLIRCWARNTAATAAGRDAFPEVVTRLAGYESLARRANDPELADYLRRLGSYGVPGPVDREGAHQRGRDLTRSYEPKPEEVTVERDGACWRVELPERPKILRIAFSDGRIS